MHYFAPGLVGQEFRKLLLSVTSPLVNPAVQLGPRFNCADIGIPEAANCTPGERRDYPTESPPLVKCLPFPFDEAYFPTYEIVLKVIFTVIAMFLAIFGNIFVLVVIGCNKRMHNRTYVYMANLAASDLMVGVFNMWVLLGASIHGDSSYPFSATICKLFPFFQILALSASTGFLTVIAGERFFAIVFPLRARFSHHARTIITIVVTWIFAALVALPTLLVRELLALEWKDKTQVWCDERWPRYVIGPDPTAGGSNTLCLFSYPERQLYYTLQVVVMYFVPVLVMTGAYCIIADTLRRRKPPGNQTDSVVAAQQRTKRKVVRMLVIVFVVFVVCWTPQEILVLISVYEPQLEIGSAVRFVAIFIAYLNSSLNPILYAGLNENFRRGFRELTECRKWKRNRISPAPLGPSAPPVPGPGRPNPTTAEDKDAAIRISPSLYNQGRPRLPTIEEDLPAAHTGASFDRGVFEDSGVCDSGGKEVSSNISCEGAAPEDLSVEHKTVSDSDRKSSSLASGETEVTYIQAPTPVGENHM